MILTLKRKILLAVIPMFVLLTILGIMGTFLIMKLGERSDAILRENYNSVRAMNRLIAAVQSRDLTEIRIQLMDEQKNITILPVEAHLVDDLKDAIDRFTIDPSNGDEVRRIATEILDLNESEMRSASAQAQATARQSVQVLMVIWGISTLLAIFASWWLYRTILNPIRNITDAAKNIGGGQLHLLVPVYGNDELGHLGESFNAMTAKLRLYRQTNTAKLMRAQRTAQATIDSFLDPIIVVDNEGLVELANPAAQRLLGVQLAQDGQHRQVWHPPDSLKAAMDSARRFQQPTLTDSFAQAVVFRINDEDHQFLPQIRPIRTNDNEILGTAVVLNDITRFRLLDQLKSDWVATVSHELKTPLTSVRLAVHVLLEEIIGPLEPKQIELLIEARESTERLLRLIEQLLAMARLEDGRDQLRLEWCDPIMLLREVVDDAMARAEDKHVKLMLDLPAVLPQLKIDRVRIRRALDNLVDNAIRYTDSGGTITISSSDDSAAFFSLMVADTGVGIPDEYLPHVFERFFRVPGRDTPGTGLGLAIVKDVIEMHGGTIQCNSQVGSGTVFTLKLPRAKEAS